MKWGRYLRHGEHKCDGGNCDNFVPEGQYGSRPAYLTCSYDCWHRRSAKGNLVLKCSCGCGQDFLRPYKRKTLTGLVFASKEHMSAHLIDKYLAEHCGSFRKVVDEYLNGFAAYHYRDPKSVRSSIARFFMFLNNQNIVSIDNVTPKTITEFVVWAKKPNRGLSTHTVSSISTFFKWMIAEGRWKAGNPVVGLIHNEKRKQKMPRPYQEGELDFIHQLLRERGNSRLRLAAAIALEAGLRIGEICRLHIKDVDMVQRRLFVGLPTKTSRERWAPFHHLTSQCCDAWMQERDPDCRHDYLLHNNQGDPMSPDSLAEEFKRVLCTTYRGKKNHDTGLASWSTHRLRHTFATNLVSGGADAATVMAAGGWVTADSMFGYAQVDPALACRGYNEAMRRASEQKEAGPRTRTLTPAEFLKRRQIGDVIDRTTATRKRCV
jgi:site-specific recombinase XerD